MTAQPSDPHDLAGRARRIGMCRTLDEAMVLAQIAAMTRHADLRAGRSPEALAAARITLDTLRAAGLARGVSGYDLTEVVNLLALVESGRGAFALSLGGVETGRHLVTTLADGPTTDRPPELSMLPPRRFAVRFERTFHVSEAMPARPRRLRLPLPVVDAQLRSIEVATDAGARLRPGRIELRPPDDAVGPLTLSATYSFVSDPAASHGVDDDPAPWLTGAEGAIRVTPRVRELAERLGRGLDDEAAILAFRDHLLDAFGCGLVHHHRIGTMAATDWVLENRWYDCRLGAALLAALCRARGIPARLVGGYLMWDAPAEHYWTEVWRPGRGWRPYDLMAWGLSAGGLDPDWRRIYAGAIDYRMKTQLFPTLVTGSPGVPVGGSMFRLATPIPDGMESRFVTAEDGLPLYTDRIRFLTT